MIVFLRIPLIIIVFLLLFGLHNETHVKITSEEDYTNTIRFTEKKIKQMMHKHHLPGFAITILDDQEIVFQKTFGLVDLEKNVSTSTETVFKLWSVAKAFTAMEIFREVENGLIDLDAPIIEFLPDFSIQKSFNDNHPITVRSILAHRAGLPRNECVSISDPNSRPGALEKFEKSTAECYLAFPVGYRYKYSNLGYDLLGRIIEQNRGEGYAAYMKKNILNDLGMVNSTFNSTDITDPDKLAKGYEFYKKKYYPMEQTDISSIPSGNLYSTIEDLSVFLKSILANNGIFQNEETLPIMYSDNFSKTTDPETMGLGWKTSRILGSELLIWHDGGPSDGIGSLLAFLPNRKLGIALIANGTSFEGSVSVPMAIDIFQQLLETKPDFTNIPEDKPKRVVMNREKLDSYAGKYVVFGTIMKVESKNKKLKGKIAGIGLDLIPVNETGFRITHWSEKIGLTKIIKPPIDFGKIRIEFLNKCQTDSSSMIINFDNISHEICPRYPEIINIIDHWGGLPGEYILAERLPNNKTGPLTGRKFSINLTDDVLVMSGQFGPIAPLNDKFIIIKSGPFAGELMQYDAESGNIIHQNAIYIPVK